MRNDEVERRKKTRVILVTLRLVCHGCLRDAPDEARVTENLQQSPAARQRSASQTTEVRGTCSASVSYGRDRGVTASRSSRSESTGWEVKLEADPGADAPCVLSRLARGRARARHLSNGSVGADRLRVDDDPLRLVDESVSEADDRLDLAPGRRPACCAAGRRERRPIAFPRAGRSPQTRSSRRSRETTRLRVLHAGSAAARTRAASGAPVRRRPRPATASKSAIRCVAAGSRRRPRPRRSRCGDTRAHARRQLAEAERLGDVVVGAELEAGDPVVLARARGQHDDRHVRAVGARSQDAAHFERRSAPAGSGRG